MVGDLGNDLTAALKALPAAWAVKALREGLEPGAPLSSRSVTNWWGGYLSTPLRHHYHISTPKKP